MVDVRIPRDGAVFWFEDPEYWENFAGYLTQKAQSDVAIYSSMPHIDNSEAPKSKEAVAFRHQFLELDD